MTRPRTSDHPSGAGSTGPLLFVYGTLLPDQSNWFVLEPWVAGPGRPDTATGAMFDTGLGWPAVAFGAPGRVVGHVFELRHETAAEAFVVLDEFEGIHEGAYTRIEIRTGSGRTAWAYHAGRTFPVAIPDGDWAAHCSR